MKFSFRRLVFTVIFILLIGATTVISAFLATFDLNNFRAEVSDAISTRLSQPVSLGQAHFSMKHGPSFTFDQILIGSKNAPLHITADHVFFRLEVLPLLFGKVKFTELLFEAPDVTIRTGLPRDPQKAGRRLVIDQSLVSGDLIRSIRIRDGNIRLEDHRDPNKPFTIALEKLRMVADDLSLRESGWVDMQADLLIDAIRSPFRLSGHIRAGGSSPFWNHADYELEMRVADFASDVVTQRYRSLFSQVGIRGRSDIHIQISGSPAEGLKFNTHFTGRDLGLLFQRREREIRAGEISFSGTWQHLGGLHKLTGFHLGFDTMDVYGDGHLDLEKSDPELLVKLSAPRIPLTDFNRFMNRPDGSPAAAGAMFNAGTFNLKSFLLFGPLSKLSGPEGLSAVREFDLEILRGGISLGESKYLDNFNADIEWKDRTLRIHRLSAESAQVLVDCDGTFSLAENSEDDSLRLAGRGSLSLYNRDSERTLLPEKGLKASLHLDALHRDGRWTLSNNLLALPSIKMIANGDWDWRTEKSIRLDVVIPELPLADLPLLSPAVRAIHPEGTMAATIRFSRNGGNSRLSGSMSLKDVHLKILGPLAPLDRLNGVIDLDWPRLGGQNLVANLGESPITLGLDIPDLTVPRVDLSFRGDSIRADELIFRSERQYLRDVDARVTITDRALILGPIHTRMDGGTDVSINGTIDNFPAADTRLIIDGKYGNIDEVIGLWISDREYDRRQKKKRRQGELEIAIRTDAGEIANLPFEKSEAHISYRDRTLIIHPISFKSGPGFGLGQVLVAYRDDQPPLLKMSGHLEDFDALAVYQQLLQRKGIVTGRLRGDFYLEGTAGKLKETFLPSSFGSFNFEVRDGNLKKLRSLSEVLTIFNIYPLFTESGKERGVPFELLRGNARIDGGILRTDDLFMKGNVMNMSMSGTQNLITTEVDLEMGIMPLRTIDRLITKIPLAGWVLAGEDKALVTAHFKLTGPGDDPEVTPIPIESASKQVLGVFERLFTLPVKIISDVGKGKD